MSLLYVQDSYNDTKNSNIQPNIKINTCYQQLIQLQNLKTPSLLTQFDQLCLNLNWHKTKLHDINYFTSLHAKYLMDTHHQFNSIQIINDTDSTDKSIMFPILRYSFYIINI